MNTRQSYLPILFLFLLFVAAGCGSSKEAEKRETASETLSDFLSRSEKEFTPSDYDEDPQKVIAADKEHATGAAPAAPVKNEENISVPGFRVQVLFTQDIDQANTVKDSLASLMPQEWSYVVYDAPYYKVRVGNYLDRGDASRMVKTLVDLGFPDAWIVPDHVQKSPPPRPVAPAEEEKDEE